MALRSAIAKGGQRALASALGGPCQARSMSSTVKLELPPLPYEYELRPLSRGHSLGFQNCIVKAMQMLNKLDM